MALSEITRDSVLAAMREHDELGAADFLKKSGFGKSRGFTVVHEGREYPSKAIAGVAHGKLGVGYNAFEPKDFSGGEKRVATLLRRLGFTMLTPSSPVTLPFVQGRIYERRRDIHQEFGGQQQGGIATPIGTPFVFVFTGETGEQYGYLDGYQADGSFSYTGEGQIGDQKFEKGNKAIRDHVANNCELLLFQDTGSGHRFVGIFTCIGWTHRSAPDRNKNLRQVIVFRLVANETPLSSETTEIASRPGATILTLEELRKRAIAAATESSNQKRSTSTRTYYERSEDVKVYVLARANGICEACHAPAPFSRPSGTAYLEPHHIKRVSDGGPDHPGWVAAICPNCHRRIHHGADGKTLNGKLAAHVVTIEERIEQESA